MTKADLIEKVVKDSGVTKAAAEEVLKAILSTISKSLKKGEPVSLIGFGTFSVGKRAARIGRNPQTGAALKIKASKTAKFKAGKALKDAIK